MKLAFIFVMVNAKYSFGMHSGKTIVVVESVTDAASVRIIQFLVWVEFTNYKDILFLFG